MQLAVLPIIINNYREGMVGVMKLPIFEKYIDELIEKSTLDVPAWNIEKAREGKVAGWNYIDGCMILALLEIYQATGEEKYYEFADAFIDHRVKEDGSIVSYSVEEYNIDNVNAGKTLFSLYGINGKEKYRKAIDLIYSQVQTQPRTEEGNFWHKKIYPNQVWLDGMYMGQPFIWSMRRSSIIRRTMEIFSASSLM